jgi:hypothetical protein
MVTFNAEYGDLPTLSLAKVSSLSGVSVAEHHVLCNAIGKSVPATELPAGGSLPIACYGQDQHN